LCCALFPMLGVLFLLAKVKNMPEFAP